MAEPFKNFINAQVVDSAARHLARAWPAFDARRFRALALAGLDGLELKARAQHLCAALEVTLPSDFAQAAAIIEASLAPVRGDEDLAGSHSADDGLTGWVLWPVAEFVSRRGLDSPERALVTLRYTHLSQQ